LITGEPIEQVSLARTIVKYELTRHGTFPRGPMYYFILFSIFHLLKRTIVEPYPSIIRQRYEKILAKKEKKTTI